MYPTRPLIPLPPTSVLFFCILHTLQEIRLADVLPVRGARTLGDLLPALETRDGTVAGPRQIPALLVHGDLHRYVLAELFLPFVVSRALFLRHC